MATTPRVKRASGLVSKLATILAVATPLAPGLTARGGDWMPGGRYLLPLLVVLVGGAVAAGQGQPGELVQRLD